jgi:hypothetical protein
MDGGKGVMAYNAVWGRYISDGLINDTIRDWQAKQPDRVQTVASPSTLKECPRVVWLKKHGYEPTNKLGWGKKQRFMLGRITENMIARQLDDEGHLLWHWKDDYAGESDKFTHGEGLDRLEGTPDLLIKLGDKVAISDSKTSRGDSFKYVPIEEDEIWEDPFWYKNKLQLTAYFMLAHWNKEWFERPENTANAWTPLPLPEVCHLFSYALDDGIVRRELSWTPTNKDVAEVKRLVRRWNSAYQSETMPECTCEEDGSVIFCAYGIMPEGKNICTSCCDIKLKEEV